MESQLTRKKGVPPRGRWPMGPVRAAVFPCLLVGVIALIQFSAVYRASAVTPQSPEVRKLIDAGLEFLATAEDDPNGQKLGGRCLVGLAFLKANRRDHPRVASALKACRDTMAVEVNLETLDVYSNGLAIIFLSEASAQDYRREIQWYLNVLRQRQKGHGGWGYSHLPSGDTSQTQYAALGLWEAHRAGFRLDASFVELLAEWLMRTQGPDGAWGYQGIVGPPGELVPQSGVSGTMLAAGLGSTYICADLFGFRADLDSAHASSTDEDRQPPLPAALRRIDGATPKTPLSIVRSGRIKAGDLGKTIRSAHAWMNQNYKIETFNYTYYYLYALERCKSFQEFFGGEWNDEPTWYNEGFELLRKQAAGGGSWNGGCGPTCDTAFAVLFLLRSTKQSIRKGIGEGALTSGRGLPSNLSKAKLVGGQLVIEQTRTRIDELLAMVDAGDDAKLDDLARDSSQLMVDKVDEQNARRLQQLARGGEPDVRLLAVRALGRSGKFDYVTTLIYALTDPDRRVVLEARDGLRFISRRFKGAGPPDDFTDQQRYEAVDAWKQWYRALRPDAVFE